MKKLIATASGVMVAALAGAYLLDKDHRLRGLLNTERNLTLMRIPIAVSLLYAGVFGKERTAGSALASVGSSYIGMGTGALVDPSLGGTLKKGFNKADIAFHLAVGVALVGLAILPAHDEDDD